MNVTEVPSGLVQEIYNHIAATNNDRGPFGVGIKILATRGRMLNKEVQVQAFVCDRNEKALWAASAPMWVSVGGSITFSDLAKAFRFNYSAGPL